MGDLKENREIREDNELNIDWSKFKGSDKGSQKTSAKNAYIEFCKMLNEVDFKLVSDYVKAIGKVNLKYKLNHNIELNIMPYVFKGKTYKSIVNFKNNLKENNDTFVEFIGLTDKNNLIAKIQTFDGGEIEMDIASYTRFNKARKDFYNILKQINGYTDDSYRGKDIKINIFIDSIKLNPISPDAFKNQTHKAILEFKNNLIKNRDELIEFIDLTSRGILIAQIKTFDGGIIEIDMANYVSFNKSRQNTYNYCKEKGYKILSPYISNKNKILVDFKCKHNPHWIIPHTLKQNQGCPMCDESKGEKYIRLYLKENNIEFKQEYKFNDCRYKLPLPFDFYIPNYNLCIEYDGEQHYKANDFFGGEKSFKDTQIRDKIKNNYCKDNNINLLRIPYWELDSVEDILDEEFDRLREMKEVC